MLFLPFISAIVLHVFLILYFLVLLYKWHSTKLKKILLKERNAKFFYFLGDISYALGIGVAGNGFYELLSKSINELYAIIIGMFAIIGGTILRERNKYANS